MDQLVYPYDELSLSLHQQSEILKVHISTPWLKLIISGSIFEKKVIERFVERLNLKVLSSEDLHLINHFFKGLEKYPLCYLLPFLKDDEYLDRHVLMDDTLKNLNIHDMLIKINGQTQSYFIEGLFRREWAWDCAAAISFSQVDGKVNPESLFSVARRYRLLEVMEQDRGNEVLHEISLLKGKDFIEAASCLIRQNHYVTQRCQDALGPALNLAGRSCGQVKAFMKEEEGHDLIIQRALESMGFQADQVPVSEHTKCLMNLLKYCASRNFLAFSMVVDAFERSTYEQVDPMAKLLMKGGLKRAAELVNRHMEINDKGGHENIALSFLKNMGMCDIDYAIEALRLTELVTLVMNQFTISALHLKAG